MHPRHALHNRVSSTEAREKQGEEVMKSKIVLGLVTLASLAIPSFAAETYCRLDGDGDRQICTTTGYDAYGRYYQQTFSQPARRYAYDPDPRQRREERERRERMEHERRDVHGYHDYR